MPVQVKICGITRTQDAELAIRLGADLLGINFYSESPRHVGLDAAQRIAEVVTGQVPRVLLVGVFVNHSRAQVEQVAAQVPLDLLQFHGDESAELVESFGNRAIKVFRVGSDVDELRQMHFDEHPSAWGFLLDAKHPKLYGGSGASWNHQLLDTLRSSGAGPGSRPLLAAGGIRPQNIRQVLAQTRAWGVDVCSGVESAPGVKDPELMEQLFQEIRNEEIVT